jgi:hypothetical protein
VQTAGPDLLGGGNDRIGTRRIEQAELAIASGRRQFDRSQRPDEIGVPVIGKFSTARRVWTP